MVIDQYVGQEDVMDAVNLSDAKARLSELVDRAEGGAEVEILRRGRPVARLVAVSGKKQPISIESLRRVTENQAEQSEPAGEFMRRMRDESRY
jgi:prevent-host-death family protein